MIKSQRSMLEKGARLGPHQIVALISSGGMGEVYMARDTRLDRTVAIKVLRTDHSSRSEFRARFESEARVISGLNHPNICTLYDVGRQGSLDYLVMEYLDGETLTNSLLRQGPLPIPRVLQIARDMTAALVHAHRKEIVHRDLKPGNIMLTSAGLKLLDFGLAKLVLPPAPSSNDSTLRMNPETVAGVLLGTVAYMSPEQAEGKAVDTRSDIFSFGAVLYEMVTGRQPFRGDTSLATLAAIHRDEPTPVSESRPDVPAGLAQVINRCLRKDPAQRFQHIEDAGVVLDEVYEQLSHSTRNSGATAALPPRPEARPASLPGWIKWLATAAGVLAISLAAAWWLESRRSAVPALPGLTRLTSDPGLNTDPVISSDGRLIAFASDRATSTNLDIWVQQTSGGGALQLTNDPADEHSPDFSPDGSTIAFRSERGGGGIYLTSALGGEARLLAAGGRDPRYSPQGDRIAYFAGDGHNSGSRLFIIPAAGGESRELPLHFRMAISPLWSPDGKHLLFYGVDKTTWDWWVVPVSGNAKPVATNALDLFRSHKLERFIAGQATILPGLWNAQGDVVFAARLGDSTGLWRIAVPLRGGPVTGTPERLTLGMGEDVSPSAAADGRMVFSSQISTTSVVALPADPNSAKVTGTIARLTQDSVLAIYPHTSSDGTWVVWESNRVGSRDIWIKNLITGETRALVSSEASESAPRLSRDGTLVAYSVERNDDKGSRNDLYSVPSRGGAARLLCEGCGRATYWSNDNRLLLFDSAGPHPYAIFVLDVTSGKRTQLFRAANDIYSPRFSPDDKWIAFHGQTSATSRAIYVAPFQGDREIPKQEWIAVTDGTEADREPYWSPDGRSIYFLSDRDGFRCIWVQRVDAVTRRPEGRPVPVYHFHSARSSLSNVNWATGLVGFSLARDKFVFSLGEVTGNIWLTKLPR